VCCGTKRLTEIRCPADCRYLASAREHPPAAAVRQQQRDVGLFVRLMHDFNRRQSELFLAVNTLIARHQPLELQPLVDDDVRDAAAAVAATLETSSRGVIYEHRPASIPAGRLAVEIKALVTEAGKGGGTPFEREAAVTLRRLEQATRDLRAAQPRNERAYLDLLARVMRKEEAPGAAESALPEASRLILP
jgi:hypothetical protein